MRRLQEARRGETRNLRQNAFQRATPIAASTPSAVRSSGNTQRGRRAPIQVSKRFSGLASRKLGSRVASTDFSSSALTRQRYVAGMNRRRVALVTGASSGIGAAAVRALAAAGLDTIAAARRLERCEEIAAEVGGRALRLDVADPDSVAALAAEIDALDVIVHSAGGALGLEPVAEADEERWRQMWESNVAGVMRVTKALLDALRAGIDPQIVIVGSVAGVEVYEGGGGYVAAKHAVRALAKTLRLELLSERVRVTEIAPGMVETEFSVVRFGGDEGRAAAVYEGVEPLRASDVAEAIAFCVTRPRRVDVDYLGIMPTAQATAKIADRRG
jgi:NADP-dependent 3-hydroxy acid dehydrogenase YdfG